MRELIKVENKSKEEIEEIGREIGEAFVAEKAGIVTMLTGEQAVRAFEIMTECYNAVLSRDEPLNWRDAEPGEEQDAVQNDSPDWYFLQALLGGQKALYGCPGTIVKGNYGLDFKELKGCRKEQASARRRRAWRCNNDNHDSVDADSVLCFLGLLLSQHGRG